MSQKAQLNKPAPDFALPDFNGQEIALSDFKDKKNVVLVFNRGFM
jgi:peroxiredoxin